MDKNSVLLYFLGRAFYGFVWMATENPGSGLLAAAVVEPKLSCHGAGHRQ
jgi:hypothetical protein